MTDYLSILRQYWGYDSFRGIQQEIIESIGSGNDTLGLMPTGGGKSVTFQVPALAMDGMCLVITPLIALMKDQVRHLREQNIRALAIYAGMTRSEINQIFDNAIFGDYKFLYVSPERLETEMFRQRLKQMHISMIVVDESHCISQWGYDFRPSYLNIAAVRELLPDVPVLALTATATPTVVEDIQRRLGFQEPNVLKMSFRRENLQYIVRRTENKPDQIAHILSKVPGSAIVYVRNRKRAQELAEWLNQQSAISNQQSVCDFYHAGLTTRERNERQEAWKEGRTRVIVATNAFGMGIDKPDVRLVIHHDLPSHLESYYQEAGRAGRDGMTAYAVLLYNDEDKAKARKRVVDTYPPKEFVEQVYHKTMDFLQIGEGSGLGHRFALHMDQLCHVMHLPVIQTYSALHLLTQAGYIDFQEEYETQPRVCLRVPRAQLGEYDLSSPQIELLDRLMRQYSGIFTDLQYVREADKPEDHELLVSLAQRGIITYIPRSVGCCLTMTKEREAEIYLSPAIFDDRQKLFAEQLNAMVEYAEQNQFCREQVLLAYFGETSAIPCGHCDVCREITHRVIAE